jgi:hypothetical protein
VDSERSAHCSRGSAPRPHRQKRISGGWAHLRVWLLNCNVLSLNIEGLSRFLRKWPSAVLGGEPPDRADNISSSRQADPGS